MAGFKREPLHLVMNLFPALVAAAPTARHFLIVVVTARHPSNHTGCHFPMAY